MKLSEEMSALRKSLSIVKKRYGVLTLAKRTLSVLQKPSRLASRQMRGWQTHSYGGIEELQQSDAMRIPIISSADEVLVKVHSAGVNPIDVMMLRGYGAPILNLARKSLSDIEFPLTLGREFTGTVVQKGMGTSNRLEIGQKVWGAVPLQRQGSHAEYVVVSENTVAPMPAELTPIEGSAVLYSGLTAWAGIFLTSNFANPLQGIFSKSQTGPKQKRVLVLGASGSVGSLAAQILKAENATVIASCANDAVSLVQTLGVDHIIDYTDQASVNDFSLCGPYDIILDCAGQGPAGVQKYGWQFKEYITFSAPLLRNVDENGLIFGMAKNIKELVESNVKTLSTKQGCVKWAYFVPALSGIEYLTNLVQRKKLLPKIDSTFSFAETPEAYKKVNEGHLRGKVVIDFEQ